MLSDSFYMKLTETGTHVPVKEPERSQTLYALGIKAFPKVPSAGNA